MEHLDSNAESISTLKKERTSFELFLCSKERDLLKEACWKMRKIPIPLSMVEFHSSIIPPAIKQVLSRNPYPSFEAIWNLHVCQVISIEFYIISLDYEKLNEFKSAMFELCLYDSKGDKSKEFVQTGMMSFFLCNAYEADTEQFQKISESIVNEISQGIFSLKKEDLTKQRTRTFYSLWNCGTLEKCLLHKFSLTALTQYTTASSSSVVDAFSIQENCYDDDDPFHMHTVIYKLIQSLDTNSVEHLLFDILVWEEETNWKNCIVVVHIFIKMHEQAAAILTKHVGELLKKSLQTLNENMFHKAIVIARQSILALNPKSSYPGAYKNWCMTQFGCCQLLKNPQVFNFIIQVLSDLIPYETNVHILKMGLEQLFPVVAECQSALADYRALLKTRINDLEPRTQPENVIEKLLSAFEDTGRIPSYVLEASLMRKHYFLNEFLPVLLNPRVIPAFPDARSKFIAELEKVGKIPVQMLQKYKAMCLQEKQRLNSGKV